MGSGIIGFNSKNAAGVISSPSTAGIVLFALLFADATLY